MGIVKERREPNRRTVVAAGLTASGGLAIAAGLPGSASADGVPSIDMGHGVTLASSETIPPDELSAFLVVHKDSSVLVRLPHQEMGQGTSTALAMLAAEELGCDWSKVRM